MRHALDTINPFGAPTRAGLAGALFGALVAGTCFSGIARAENVGFVETSRHPAPTALVAVPMTAPDFKADLDKGFALLGKGQDEKAVSYFDRVIAAADTLLAGDSRPRRCVDMKAAKLAVVAGHANVDDALCDAHFGRGFALIDLGRGDLAEADLRSATEMAPGNAHFANEYAELFKSRRDWQTAYTQFERAWSVADKTIGGPNADLAARALRGMGYAQEKMGHLDKARALVEQSLQFEPDSMAARAQLSHVARMQALGS